MADKFKSTYPIKVSFADGEQPTAAKLNSVSTQSKNGLTLIERALGDVWTQSGDATMNAEPLQIATLARAVGQQYQANAVMHKPNMGDTETIQVVQDVSSQDGQTEIHLDFKPSATDTVLEASLTVSGFAANGVATRDLVATATDYFIDTDEGIIYLGAPSGTALTTLEYEVKGLDFPTDSSSTSSYNVIPHPEMNTGWEGIKIISLSTGKFLLVLPPRRPLGAASEIGKIPREANNSVSLGGVDRYWYISSSNWGTQGTLAGNSLALASSKRYRHVLPEVIDTLVTGGALGATIPSGSLFLWDNTNNTIIEGITFRVPEADTIYGGGRAGWVIQAEASILDNLFSGLDSLITVDDPVDYKQRFSIITVGEGAAEKARTLATELVTQNSGLGVQSREKHSSALLLNPINRDPGGGGDTYANPPAAYREGDDHSYLLSREGSTTDGPSQRDRYNNAYLGDFLLAAVSGTTRQGITVDSQAIHFGDMTTGGSLYGRVGTSINFQFTGATTAHTYYSSLDNSPLFLAEGILGFGTDGSLFPGTFHGIIHDGTVSYGGWFKFAGDNSAAASGITAGRMIILGTPHSIHTARATEDAWTGVDDAEWIQFESTNGPANVGSWKGAPLDMSATTGVTGDDATVQVGLTNANTHLRIINKRIQFDDDTNYFEFDGSDQVSLVTSSSSSAATFRSGKINVRASADQIQMGTGFDYLSHESNEFWFKENNSSPSSTLNVGTLKATEVEATSHTFPSANTGYISLPLAPTKVLDGYGFNGPASATGYHPALTEADADWDTNYARPLMAWVIGTGTRVEDIWHFPIPWMPHNCTITEVQVKVQHGASTASHQMVMKMYRDITTTVFEIDSPTVSTTGGTQAAKTYTATTSTLITTGTHTLSLGIDTSTNNTCVAALTSIRIKYTYDALKL